MDDRVCGSSTHHRELIDGVIARYRRIVASTRLTVLRRPGRRVRRDDHLPRLFISVDSRTRCYAVDNTSVDGYDPRQERRVLWFHVAANRETNERVSKASTTERELHAHYTIPRSAMATGAGRRASCTRRRKPRLSADGSSDWRTASATYARRWRRSSATVRDGSAIFSRRDLVLITTMTNQSNLILLMPKPSYSVRIHDA